MNPVTLWDMIVADESFCCCPTRPPGSMPQPELRAFFAAQLAERYFDTDKIEAFLALDNRKLWENITQREKPLENRSFHIRWSFQVRASIYISFFFVSPDVFRRVT